MQPFPMGLYVALGTQGTALAMLAAAAAGGTPAQVLGCALFVLITMAIIIYDFRGRAMEKGYSGWLGWLGVLNILGLIVILMLPQRQRREARGFEVQLVKPATTSSDDDDPGKAVRDSA